MIIAAVHLSNFKKHEDLRVEFSKGTNTVVGGNYVGKSTVLQAVLLGLWGNSAAPGETADLIKTGFSSFTVTLELSNGFKIVRTPRDSKVLNTSGETVVRTHTEVNKYVEETLGVSRKTFLNVFASQQGSPQSLLSMGGADLQRFIEVCLGVDAMDKVIKKADAEIAEEKVGLEYVQEHAVSEEELTELKKQRQEAEGLSSALVCQRQEAEEAVTTLRLLIRGLETRHKEETESLILWAAHDSSLALRLQELEEAKKEKCPVFTDVTEDTEELAALQELFDTQVRLQARNEALKEVRSRSSLSVAALKKKLQGLVACPSVVTQPAQKILEQSTEKVVAKGREIAALEEAIKSSVCPTCQSELVSKVAQEANHEKLLDLREEVDRLSSVRVAAVAFLQQLKDVEEKANKYQEEKRGLLKSLEAEELSLRQVGEVVECQGHFLSGGMQKDLTLGAAYVAKLLEENRKAEGHEEKIRRLTGDVVRARIEPGVPRIPESNIVQEKEKAQNTLFGLHEKSVEAASLDATNLALVQRLALEVKAQEKYAAKVKARQKALRDLTKVSSVVRSVRKAAVKSGFDRVMGVASGFVSSCTGGDISEVALTDSGIRYKENGISRGTVNASGAQKTLIGLGMKLGLAQIVPSVFDSLVLDEVTADMDEEVSLACLTALGNYAEQVIVVSHRDMDAADNLIQL